MSKRPRGPLPGWQPTTDRQKAILADLIPRYAQHRRDDTLPRGPRGIFYDLRPKGMGHGIEYRKKGKNEKQAEYVARCGPRAAHAGTVQEVLVLARRAGIIDERCVADTRAPAGVGGGPYDDDPQEHAEWVVGRLDSAAENFDLDPQLFQPVYIEVLCEAEDLQPRLERIADPYGVTVYSGAGFDGLKGKRAFAERARERDRPTVVLDVGDYDKSGENIYTAAAEDAVGWARGGGEVLPIGASLDDLAEYAEMIVQHVPGEPWLIFYRLALTAAQAEGIPDVLDVDGKAEADAIPVRTLDGWLTEAIEYLQDPAGRDRMGQEQDQRRKRVENAIRDLLRKRLEGGDER